MSTMIFFAIKDKSGYCKINEFSKELVKFGLKINKGINFNCLGYGEDVISLFPNTFYFLITDDFVQLNSDFLTIRSVEELDVFTDKDMFSQRFEFLDYIYSLLSKYGYSDIDLVITVDESINSRQDYVQKYKNKEKYIDILFDNISESDKNYGYGFPNIVISTKS